MRRFRKKIPSDNDFRNHIFNPFFIYFYSLVFQVQRTNNRVLSLFGLISLIEIIELANKCEKFIVNFLVEKENQKEISEEIEKDENKNIDVKGSRARKE